MRYMYVLPHVSVQVDVLQHALGPARKRKAYGPDLTVALRECILELDEQVLERFSRRQGTTATLALLRGNELVVAGVGDSRWGWGNSELMPLFGWCGRCNVPPTVP